MATVYCARSAEVHHGYKEIETTVKLSLGSTALQARAGAVTRVTGDQ